MKGIPMGLRAPHSLTLILSSLVAWCAAMSVDVYQINHGSKPLLLGYLLNLAIWLLAQTVALEKNRLLKAICLVGLAGVIILSVNPKTLLAPVMLTFWMSYLPSLISERQVWVLYVGANGLLIALMTRAQADTQNLITALSFIAFQLFAISSALQRIELGRQKDLLVKSNMDLIAAQSLLLQKSKAEERQRISRNLHDSIGQQLTSLSLQTEHALQTQSYKSESDFSNYLKTTKRDLKEALNTLRKTVKEFRNNDTLSFESTMRLIASKIPKLAFEFSNSAFISNAHLIEDLIYCCQEGISNALRHGQAEQIKIDVSQQDTEVLVRVIDNGRGPTKLAAPAANSGTGLEGIACRLRVYGASVKLTKNHSQGSCLEISVPFEQCSSKDYQ